MRDRAAPTLWQPIETAPRDGFGFLAYGRHDTDNGLHWQAGDHWWAIIQWDIWREPKRWVFGKDGTSTWSEPTHWMPLPLPPGDREANS